MIEQSISEDVMEPEVAAVKTLEQCEDILASSMGDFVSVGTALAAIKEQGLFRGTIFNYTCFADYCQKRWALPRHTAFIKIEVSKVYQRLCDHQLAENLPVSYLPQNEAQVRQLLILHNEELQLRAWEGAVKLQQDTKTPLTADTVKAAVAAMRTAQMLDFRQFLTADDTFPYISYRLDVYQQAADGAQVLKFNPMELLNNNARPQWVNLPLDNPMILVNPLSDLILTPQPELIAKLHDFLSSISGCTFLLWSRQYQHVLSLRSVPDNVELLMKVTTQQQMDSLLNCLANEQTTCSLWLVPTEPIKIPSKTFDRILIGPYDKQEQLTQDPRKLLATVLRTSMPLFISTPLRDKLGEEVTSTAAGASEYKDGEAPVMPPGFRMGLRGM